MVSFLRKITFENNLKFYRTKCGLTQKQLAEKIGYTEKSVSKWESGNALPTMEILIKLADIFKISLDELMFEKTSLNYFLGIDGGGTKTVFKLVDENDTVISIVCKASSNPNDIGMENTMALLKEGINEVCNGIPYSKITLFAGLSGGGLTGDNAKVLNRFFKKFGFYAFENGSDIENLVSLSDSKKCILVIMGTGFIVYALNDKDRKKISGWGQFFDEGGSGYTFGRDAITAALCDLDGSGKQTVISQLLEKRLGESAAEHLPKFYQGSKRYIAEFADIPFQAAKCGDEIALEILDNNMEFVAQKIDAAAKFVSQTDTQKIPVLFSGGIAQHEDTTIFSLIEKHLKSKSCELKILPGEQVDGAVKKAKAIFKGEALWKE